VSAAKNVFVMLRKPNAVAVVARVRGWRTATPVAARPGPAVREDDRGHGARDTELLGGVGERPL
jgi:hypothetical protein